MFIFFFFITEEKSIKYKKEVLQMGKMSSKAKKKLLF